MSDTFDWVEIRTRDIEKAKAFYASVFGWKVIVRETTDGSPYWIFDTGDVPRLGNLRRGGLWMRPEGQEAGVLVYIVVKDIDKTLAKIEEAGGEITLPKMPSNQAYEARFRDLDGNQFGLYEG